MKLLLSLTLAFIGTVAYAQNFKMIDTTPPKEVKPEIKYDSLVNIRLISEEDYQKQFIGQSILFYPRNPNSKSLPEYFANFITPHEQIVAIDTVWYKRRKKPRPSDYKLDTIKTNRYRTQYVVKKGVTLCATLSDYWSPKYQKVNAYTFIKSDIQPANMIHTGDFTPYTEIEGKTFKILDIINRNIDNTNKSIFASKETLFMLQSERGDTVYWSTYYDKYEGSKLEPHLYPVIVTGYIEKMKQLHLNREIYIRDTYPMKKYKCAEIVYSGEENQYMVPSFVLKGNDEELIVPLTIAPSLFCYKIESFDREGREKDLTFNKLKYIDATRYEAKLEEERLAAEAKLEAKKVQLRKEKLAREARLEKDKLAKEARQARLEKERLADEQAEKDRIIQKQKRKELLYKKYGQTNGKLISEGKVKIGMTKEMCIDAWGKPKSVNKSSGAWGVHEQWVYGLKTYLYFEGNKLTSIQN